MVTQRVCGVSSPPSEKFTGKQAERKALTRFPWISKTEKEEVAVKQTVVEDVVSETKPAVAPLTHSSCHRLVLSNNNLLESIHSFVHFCGL